MKAKTLFEYRDYKEYVEDALRARAPGGRGERTKLAQAMQSHGAFVSQVLGGKADLSLEQACLASEYLGHDEEEGQYFLLLVQYARAGSPKLSKFFARQIEKIEGKRALLQNRAKVKEALPIEKQAVYYSHWLYAGLHVAATIPALQNKAALAAYFQLTPAELQYYLKFLAEAGLVKVEGQRLSPGVASIYLPKDSPLIAKHHANWRLKALQAYSPLAEENLHYSGVLSVSVEDARKIRQFLLDLVERTNGLMKDSKEEKLVGLAFDFFAVK